MKFIFLMMAVLSSVSFANLTARSGIKLEKSEPYHAFLYHNSFIFVGASRSTETNQNRVEIYDSEASRRLASLDLPHTCERIFPYTADSVLIVGRENYQLRYGYYSIVSTAGKKFKLLEEKKILPQDSGFDGFYMALLERKE